MLTFWYSDPGDSTEPTVLLDLGNEAVRLGTLGLTHNATTGDPATSGVEIDDPSGTRDFLALRSFLVYETSAPSNSRLLGRWVTQDQHIARIPGGERTGSARRWSIDLSDVNWYLTRKILTDASANRPAETGGARLRWLMAHAEQVVGFPWFDYGHVTYPTYMMDAADYRHQRTSDALADIAMEGGYAYWLDASEANSARWELFFMDPNSTDYTSTISISNVASDVDSVTCFAPEFGTTLTRSGSRLAYGVDLQYANGSTYRTNLTTGTTYNYLDQSAPLANVKTLAKANAVADKFLEASDAQDESVPTSIWVPAAQVNDLRAGMRVFARFEEFPGDWTTGRWCRAKNRTVQQEEAGGEAWYRIHVDLSPIVDNTHTWPYTGTVTGTTESIPANAFDAVGTLGFSTAGTYNYHVIAVGDGNTAQWEFALSTTGLHISSGGEQVWRLQPGIGSPMEVTGTFTVDFGLEPTGSIAFWAGAAEFGHAAIPITVQYAFWPSGYSDPL